MHFQIIGGFSILFHYLPVQDPLILENNSKNLRQWIHLGSVEWLYGSGFRYNSSPTSIANLKFCILAIAFCNIFFVTHFGLQTSLLDGTVVLQVFSHDLLEKFDAVLLSLRCSWKLIYVGRRQILANLKGIWNMFNLTYTHVLFSLW